MDTQDEPRELSAAELRDAWLFLSNSDRAAGFKRLPSTEADDFVLGLSARDQAELLLRLEPAERRLWMRLLAPDDAADVLQQTPESERDALLKELDAPTRKEVQGLLAYAADRAGGLMNPRYTRLRPDMTVDEAISYLRKQARAQLETIYYAYVLDEQQHLLGVVSFRELFAAQPEKTVSDVMRRDFVSVKEDEDQQVVSRMFEQFYLLAIPVVNSAGQIKGIVTIDDIVGVVRKRASDEMQKFGGMEAIDLPYVTVGFREMIRKRGGWLSALFLGEMLTATAMGYFEDEIARAVVLALFVPLIISSGGNSGSQASTLVIRAMALGEVKLRDWWYVMRRELGAGLALGGMLATIGLLRILLWQGLFGVYGEHYVLVALTVAGSLVGVVTFGTLAGSLLPFLLRRLSLDPASASAPFVATLVDVTGLVIYFTVARLILRGALL